jgi:carboxylesterase
VVVGVPLRLAQPVASLLPIARFFVRFVPKSAGPDIRDPAARARHPSYPVMPLAAVRQLQHLQRRVRACLHRVRTPLLVAHGAHDATAKPADGREIVSKVASQERKFLLFEDSAHIVPVDYDGPALAEAVAQFLGPKSLASETR